MLAADFYDGKSTKRHVVVVSLIGETVRVRGEGLEREAPISDLRVSEPMGQAPRLITFPDGAYCEVRDHDGLKAMLQQTGFRDRRVVRWQFSRRWIALASVLCLVLLLSGYRWGLPWFAQGVASAMPASLLQSVGDEVLASLDERLLAPSRLPPGRQEALSARFAAMRQPAEGSLPVRVVFRANRAMPANALALPSGTIVLTDDLVRLAEKDNELMGVLAHELGHIQARHGMRMVVQSTVVGLLTAWFLGDISSVVAAAPAALLEARYSREFELEADRFAVRMLSENAISPRCLSDLLARLEGAAAKGDDSAGKKAGYLSTHPATIERLVPLQGPACD